MSRQWKVTDVMMRTMMMGLAALMAVSSASGCGDMGDVPQTQVSGLECDQMAPGVTVPECLLKDPTAYRITGQLSNGGPGGALVPRMRTTCELPKTFDRGAGLFKVSDIIARTENDPWHGPSEYAYVFLDLLDPVTPNMPTRLVTRQDQNIWSSMTPDLWVGDTVLAFFRTPPATDDPKWAEWYDNESYWMLERRAALVRSERFGGADLDRAPIGGVDYEVLGTLGRELEVFKQIFADQAAGKPCSIDIALEPVHYPQPPPEPMPEFEEYREYCNPGGMVCFVCHDDNCERCDEQFQTCEPISLEEAMAQPGAEGWW